MCQPLASTFSGQRFAPVALIGKDGKKVDLSRYTQVDGALKNG